MKLDNIRQSTHKQKQEMPEIKAQEKNLRNASAEEKNVMLCCFQDAGESVTSD